MAWSLKKKDNSELKPLRFTNGKTQEDIVDEVMEAIGKGHRVIFLKGICGSGKSAISLNIAKECGRASIVVPVKYLQEQYKTDYSDNMCVMKNGIPMKIQNLTGRNNFDCLYDGNSKADDKFLPCSIELRQDNWDLIKAYLKNNEDVNVENFTGVDDVRRLSVAAACPYWSPVIGKEWFGDYGLTSAKQYTYTGLKGKEFIIHKRKDGCKYYEQFMSYLDADVLIFNSRKYEIENALDRKPATDVEIIDECDEFLDKFSDEKHLNLNFMQKKIDEVFRRNTTPSDVKEVLGEINGMLRELIGAKWMKSMIDDEEIIELKNTKLKDLFAKILTNEFLMEYEELEPYYALAKNFENLMEDTYAAFDLNKREDIIAHIVNINLKRKFNEILDKNKVFVMMSGTLHSDEVLKDIFGLTDFVVIEAETEHRGIVRKNITGREKNCRYRDFQEGRITRKEYLEILQECIMCAEKPILIHVNSYADMPTCEEKEKYNLNIMSREKLQELQDRYKKGELLQMFKDGKIDVLYSTKCNRGVDLPGDMCKSIIFTKYPFPGMKDIFWKVLQKKNPEEFRKFYFDKAKREFIQRIYRGLRNHDDIVNLLSPDLRVMRSGLS
ncbi:MAG: helicase C-terminal domain-containing protein [Nanoarchaeota archaeon]|nr:helicase C-terminal domain-containing protein [Nanoarchaeota archaeon]